LRAIPRLEIEVLDKKQIKKKCGKGIYDKVKRGLSCLDHGSFRIVFREKEPESVRPSDVHPDWIVINVAHPVEPPVLVKLILDAEEENRQIDLLTEESKFL
jgi:hypothetical protein